MRISFEKICRTCMIESSNLLPLWPRNDNSVNNLRKNEENCIGTMLNSFTSVAVAENDDLPKNICLNCISEVNQAYSFKQKCERSEQTLKTYLRQFNEQQTETKDETMAKIEQSEEHEIVFENSKEIVESDGHLEQESSEQIIIDKQDADEGVSRTLYQCLNCCSLFNSNSELENHLINDHHLIYCKVCKVYYGSEEDEIHKQSHGIQEVKILSEEQNQPLFCCDKCMLYFLEKKVFLRHCKIHHNLPNNEENINELNEIQFQHVEVNEEINQKDDYLVVQTHAEAKPMPVIENIEETVVYESDTSALESNDRKVYCSICNAEFATQKSLHIHFNSKKCMQASFECDICGRVFAKKRYLLKHMVTLHCGNEADKQKDGKDVLECERLEKKKYKCTICPKAFTMLSTLKDHLRTHSGERPFLCSICGKGFSQNTNLKQHVMRHNQTKPFKCTTCKASFVSKGELNSHLRKHTGDHPFVCNICGSGFTTSSSLVKHQRIHTGERPYACDYCPMRFTALSTLKNHRRTHTGERPFQCSYCDRSFAQRSDCVSHIRTHTGERPYSCKKCKASFQQSTSLRAHMRKHV